MAAPAVVLALDTASPIVSIALHGRQGPLALRALELRRSAEQLLLKVDEILEEAGLPIAAVDGIVALRGPGSFTGLRVGLATALGLSRALAKPATALSNLQVMATAVLPANGCVTVAVDALRGEWMAQTFVAGAVVGEEVVAGMVSADTDPANTHPVNTVPRPTGEPRLLPLSELARSQGTLVGYSLHEALIAAGLERDNVVSPPPLAATAAELASRPDSPWQPELLTRPIYFRPPAVTKPVGHGREASGPTKNGNRR